MLCVLCPGRVGNLGKATSFFNQKNAPIARQLILLLREAGQEVPSFLDTAVREAHVSRQQHAA